MSQTDHDRYLAALHGVQSGIAYQMNYDGGPTSGETSPKHLRVGVNAAMIEHSALVQLLVAKGVITEDEFLAALADQAEREVESYETAAAAHLGREPGTIRASGRR